MFKSQKKYNKIPQSILLAFAIASTSLIPIQSFAADSEVASFTHPNEAEIVPGQYIVKFKQGISRTEGISILSGYNISSAENFDSIGASLLKFNEGVSDAQAMETLQQNPEIEYVEPVYRVYATVTPNDPKYPLQWGLPKIKAPQAWNIAKDSPNVVVAVIDTGVDYNHPDLKANMWKNIGEIPNNNIDDDGNGIVDDVYGANFSGATPNGDPLDDNRHGSHVAGIISGVTNNAVGISGTNWKTQIMAVKFLSASGGGTTAGAIKAIEYATKNKAQIMNNSWGGGGASNALKAAIQAASNKGILFTAAAGNSNNNNDANPHYPSNYKVANVMSIMATDQNDNKAGFSSYGKKTVHLAAPGVKIYSTLNRGRYGDLDGTSMATPFVTGAAALIKGLQPTWSPSQIKNHLMQTSDKIPGLSNRSISGGRLNLYNAVRKAKPGTARCATSSSLIAYNEFLFPENKRVSVNSNILSVTFTLPKTMIVDISTHGTAAKVTGNGARTFRTGVYSAISPNTMWTGSYRKGTFQTNNSHRMVGTNFTKKLAKGTHTIYWKLWMSGFTMKFDSANIVVRAFPCSMGGKIKSLELNAQDILKIEQVDQVLEGSDNSVTVVEQVISN